MHKTVTVPVPSYGSEVWKVTECKRRNEAAKMCFQRSVIEIILPDQKRNEKNYAGITN